MLQARDPAIAGCVLQCSPCASWLVSDRLLGSGGFARVYECTDASGGSERAAAKVIDLRVQSLWAQSKLRSEAETLRAAQGCDYIVRFLGEVRHGPFQVFVLEAWGEADLLEEVLKRQGRGLGEARARIVLVQLLEALAWLHARRICHGCAHSRARALHAPRQGRMARMSGMDECPLFA
jgi:serine/threonine protein kinase